MASGPREWLEKPRIIFPLFGIAFAIPFIFAQSERAAAFAGGLTSGIAAVIAVVLSAQFQRDNELERERRAKAAEILALATEFSVYLAPQAYTLRMQADELGFQIAPPRPIFLDTPTPVRKPKIAVSKESVIASMVPLPQRLLAQVGKLDRKTAQAIIAYTTLNADMLERISRDRTFNIPPNAIFGDYNAYNLHPMINGLANCAREAFELVDAYVTKGSVAH